MHMTFETELVALGALKQLKYFYNLPIGTLLTCLSQLYEPTPMSVFWKASEWMKASSTWLSTRACDFFKDNGISAYADFALDMEKKDPHAVFPTNIYRQCDGYTVSR